MARAVQIVQWAFAARPGHPVFLCAVGGIIDTTNAMLSAKAEGHNWHRPSTVSDHPITHLVALRHCAHKGEAHIAA